jgi:hypothetical protein
MCGAGPKHVCVQDEEAWLLLPSSAVKHVCLTGTAEELLLQSVGSFGEHLHRELHRPWACLGNTCNVTDMDVGMDGTLSVPVDGCVRVDRLSGVGGSPVARRGFRAVFLSVRSLHWAGQV